MRAISGLVIAFSILCVLLFYNIYITIVALIIVSLIGLLIYIPSKKILVDAGKLRELSLGDGFRHASEIFLSTREIKVFGVEKSFFDKYGFDVRGLASAFTKQKFLQRFPVL